MTGLLRSRFWWNGCEHLSPGSANEIWVEFEADTPVRDVLAKIAVARGCLKAGACLILPRSSSWCCVTSVPVSWDVLLWMNKRK